MTEELKERFKLWLDACLEFDDFRKVYTKMMSEAKSERVINVSGEECCEPSLTMTAKTGGLRYRLKVVDRNLDEMGARITPPNSGKLDFDGVAVLETANVNTGKRLLNEVIVMRTKDAHKLIYRELVSDGNSLQQRNVQVRKLTDNQIYMLLGQQQLLQK